MGLLDSLMGNASVADPAIVQEEMKQVLIQGEVVQRAYQVFRDSFIFTSKRLIIVDRQGLRGKKIEYLSIPYKSIVRFSIETAGTFDYDAELKIWLSSTAEPIQKTFNKKLSIYELQQVLSWYVLGGA